MATAAFKSTSRRGTDTESKAKPPTGASRRRSHSVSALSRKTHAPFDDIPTEFSNSRDNPLFCVITPPEKEEIGKIGKIAASNEKLPISLSARNSRNSNGGSHSSGEQRGRPVTRSYSEEKGIGRSLSRVRGRSVSRAPYSGAYESEKEHGVSASSIVHSRNESKRIGTSRANSVRNRADKPAHAKKAGVRMTRNQATKWSEEDSACSLQISNLEDGISAGSLSEAEDKTMKTAFEEFNVFLRNNTEVAGLHPDLVNPEAGELISDIRQEYAIQLEESEERARKLRADLAVEEHRGQELDRLLNEILPTPETSVLQRPRRGRKTSYERKRMSRRLTEEAMAYFDECVSLSTFDSSDLSASEDPLYGSFGATGPVGPSSLVKESPSTLRSCDQGSPPDQQQVQVLNGYEDSGMTANSGNSEPGSTQLYQFSFANKRPESVGPQDDIRSYIKNFERGTKKDVDAEETRSCYDVGEYSVRGYTESLLVERALHKSQIESGGLLLCGGAVSCLTLASVLW